MSDAGVILATFSIGSALIFFILLLMGHIFKQNYLRCFSLLYFLIFLSNLSLMVYANYERVAILTLSLNLLIASAYFLYRGAKQLYQLKHSLYEWVFLLSTIFIVSILSLFPNTEYLNGLLYLIGILFYYASTAVIFYKHGLRQEKPMSILLISMLLVIFVGPFLSEFETATVWISLIQGYLGLVLALYLIFIHLSRVEVKYQQQQMELQYLSYHDALTGVYNRTYLNQLLEDQTLGKQCPLVVVMMDMDNLKIINDTYGHDAGDRAISFLAAEIEAIKRQEDLVIRRSGDEFLLFMPNTEATQAKDMIQTIIKQVESISIEGIFLSISIGYAIKHDPYQDLVETIHMADQAMYQDKRNLKHKS